MAVRVHNIPIMTTGCIALLGDFSNERLPLTSLGREFCYSASRVANLDELESLCRWTDVSAVLVHAPTMEMPWQQALLAVKSIVPGARVVICHGVDQAHSIFQMTDAGAFHTLLLPLQGSEVRQSLGFISAARQMQAA